MSNCPHPDVLGYMGFPQQNGVIQISDSMNDAGTVTITNGGSGFTDGNYTDQEPTALSASGTGMKINYTVSSNAVTTITMRSLFLICSKDFNVYNK